MMAPSRLAPPNQDLGVTPYVRVRDLEADLRTGIDGEVRFDPGSRAAYSTDSSNYRQVPLGVVVPRTVDAVVDVLRICREHQAPVTSRGGGTSLAGQTCNVSVIIDWSKFCNRLVAVDPTKRTCVVEPGIALDALNKQLEPNGLMFGPRPATHGQCTLGGMLGNNSCGSTAQAYGKTVDNVVRLEVLTYQGERMWVGPTSDAEYSAILEQGDERSRIYGELKALCESVAEPIRERYPDIPRRVSGYNLDALLPEAGFNVAQAIVGSEGTLVSILQAELQLVEVPAARSLVVAGYPDIASAADDVETVLRFHPHQLEGMDARLVSFEQEKGEHKQSLGKLPDGDGWLMVSLTGSDHEEAMDRARDLETSLRNGSPARQVVVFGDDSVQERLWEVREGGLAATARPPSGPDTWPGWEDSAVPPERLGDYLRDLRRLLDDRGYSEAALYGHFGQGCVHTRIPFDLTHDKGVAAFRSFMEDAAQLVVRYGGSLSGEHGDGQARGELLEAMFGSEIVSAFHRLKGILDPDGRMNPGKIVAARPMDGDLRLGADWVPPTERTTLSFPDDDGRFDRAVMRCVGVGNCRQDHGGVMCPSFRATREEEHSTRGRSRLLFEMLDGHADSPITDSWRSTHVRDALDLCLSCKGCKKECPVGVDMAAYKAEFLHHHYAGRIRPPSHYSMGWLPLVAQLAGRTPGLVNALAQGPGTSGVMKLVGGIDSHRKIPPFAQESLQAWDRHRRERPAAPRGPVVLWPDTFTNHLNPQVGRAATAVLSDAGYQVVIPREPLCCGLTWISTGQLGVARKVLQRTVRHLAPHVAAGTPIVGLEPSCTAVFRDEAADLLPGVSEVQKLSSQTFTLAELLHRHTPGWVAPQQTQRAVAQPHCHQHAVLGFDADAALMKQMGLDVDVLDEGCCGLAGNFGFERGHYDVSMAVAENGLLPSLRRLDPEALVLADGFSCRTQIVQAETGHTPRHLAEVLAMGLDTEEATADRRLTHRSRRHKTAALAGLSALGVALVARRWS